MADVLPPTAPPSSDHPPPPPPEVPEADSQAAAPAPAVVSHLVTESDSTLKPEKEEPQDSSAATVELAESDSKELVEKEEPPPQTVVTDSKSLSVMMEKDEPETRSPETHKAAADEEKNIISMASFKEESNKVSDLSDSERKALQELKQLVQEALNTRQFTSPPKTEKLPEENLETETTEAAKSDRISPEEVSIWGIPLLKDDRSDVILLKFLRARDFKVKDAFIMIKNTIQWRKDFDIDELVDEDLGNDLEKVVFMQGHDREGHPVCYNVYGEFQNKELYQKTFSDEEKRMKFLRWRIQFLERSIRKLDFRPGGVCSIFQITDLQNSPGLGKRELRVATKQALQLLQDNYPEFVAKQVFINVPWWYAAFYTMMSPFMTQRTRSKFVFAGSTKSAETLFKYISPEQVPIQYGGLGVDFCDCNPEFSIDDPATEITVKPGTKQTVEIAIYEKCVLVWELRVVGWEVSYGAEFVPNTKDSYTVIIQKPTKMAPRGEPVVSHTFNVTELGKVLLTVDNPTSKKKTLLYRFIVKPFSD